eukprot:1558881-Prymnesium_polylepis.1
MSSQRARRRASPPPPHRTNHKRQAVAAGTAVGEAVGVGGKPAAGDEGAWTMVLSRRALQQERARLGGTANGAARKAAAARAAATCVAHGGGGDRVLDAGQGE